MKIGYARVSTQEQHLDLQRDALTKAACEKIIVDTGSGKNNNREGLAQLKMILRAGDVLVVWRLDRLGRSLKHLIEWMSYLEEMEIGFESIQESINTASPTGKLIFHIFGALAEFERNLILERTKAGLEAARARGRLGGRKKALSPDKRRMVYELYQSKQHPIKSICEMFGISKPTLYKYVKEIKAAQCSKQ